jgi:hypothetical protein
LRPASRIGTIVVMPVPPWVIDQMQQERARRDEEDRIRSQRIELPQTGVADDTRRERAAESPTASSVVVVDVSPIADNCIDI